MPKKQPEKHLPTPEYDSGRETRVLLEAMHKDIKTVAEGHSTLNNKLDNIESELSTVKSELSTVKAATMESSHRIKALETGQKEIKQKLDTVITDHEQRITKLEAVT